MYYILGCPKLHLCLMAAWHTHDILSFDLSSSNLEWFLTHSTTQSKGVYFKNSKILYIFWDIKPIFIDYVISCID